MPAGRPCWRPRRKPRSDRSPENPFLIKDFSRDRFLGAPRDHPETGSLNSGQDLRFRARPPKRPNGPTPRDMIPEAFGAVRMIRLPADQAGNRSPVAEKLISDQGYSARPFPVSRRDQPETACEAYAPALRGLGLREGLTKAESCIQNGLLPPWSASPGRRRPAHLGKSL
jgi:hypothetical protein